MHVCKRSCSSRDNIIQSYQVVPRNMREITGGSKKGCAVAQHDTRWNHL